MFRGRRWLIDWDFWHFISARADTAASPWFQLLRCISSMTFDDDYDEALDWLFHFLSSWCMKTFSPMMLHFLSMHREICSFSLHYAAGCFRFFFVADGPFLGCGHFRKMGDYWWWRRSSHADISSSCSRVAFFDYFDVRGVNMIIESIDFFRWWSIT